MLFDEIMEQRYELAVSRLAGIAKELNEASGEKKSMDAFFKEAVSFAISLDEVKKIAYGGKLKAMSIEELAELNENIYMNIADGNYEHSFTNPEYAGSRFEADYAQDNVSDAAKIFSSLITLLYSNITNVFAGEYAQLTCAFELLIEVYGIVYEPEDEDVMLKAVKNCMYYFAYDYAGEYMEDNAALSLDEENNHIVGIVNESSPSDLRYLYYYGEYIGENELGIARHLASLPEDKIKDMAATYVEGYIEGFNYAGIDLKTKKTVNIRYNIGFERIVKEAIKMFDENGLKPVAYFSSKDFRKASPRKIGVVSSSPDNQFDYDHRYDLTYFMNKPLLDRYIVCTRLAYEKYSQKATVYAGPACIEVFGEKPFVPKQKKYAISPDAKAMKLLTSYNQERSLLLDEFINLSTTSFTIIAYPIPEIGEDFKEIFDETVRINTLDKELYRNIQERLIEELNKGVGAKIKGMNGNATDIYVAFASLDDPATQTVFENCLADVNIPVGEVFTSPKLKGTSGVLNASRVYLNELEYKNLTVTFEDGMIKDYNCTNFDDEERCKKYIEENVLFGHPSLPMGEFAIGTNTAAYVMARKYNIADKLPILIAEKTGPHFAVGDTCYSMSEENRVYNPDGKEIIAKDNEVSILRKTDIEKAYFNCHTDITIPYDELGFIDVIHEDGSTVRLIDNGRFVLAGTEKLNDELDKL